MCLPNIYSSVQTSVKHKRIQVGVLTAGKALKNIGRPSKRQLHLSGFMIGGTLNMLNFPSSKTNLLTLQTMMPVTILDTLSTFLEGVPAFLEGLSNFLKCLLSFEYLP